MGSLDVASRERATICATRFAKIEVFVPMRAIILAAGRGSRMQKMTEELPKCLIKFNDRPLIEWQLEALQGAGITSVAIVTGYKRELVKKYNLTEFFNHRWAETNMVSSLACAEKWLSEQTCIVSYSDIIYLSTAVESLKDVTLLLL